MTEMGPDARRPKPKESPYHRWQRDEGIPAYRGSYVQDLHHIEVADWPRLGARGAFVNLADQEHDDGWVIELPPGGQSAVQHQLFESLVYVLDGRGATTIWQGGSDKKQTFEWQRGGVFSPPLNCYYQHFNLDGKGPVRLFAVTLAPTIINTVGGIYNSTDFIFNNPYVFSERYNAQDDYFSNPGERMGPRIDWKTNYIADVRTFKLDPKPERGEGSSNMHIYLANNHKLMSHISEWPVGTYLIGHRHGVGAHVIILDGEGYSLLWYEGDQTRRRVDWKDGDVISPRDWEYHQHFNPGPHTVRYLAFRFGADGGPYGTGPGPDSIPREKEDPAIYDEFEQECAKYGVRPRYPRPVPVG